MRRFIPSFETAMAVVAIGAFPGVILFIEICAHLNGLR